MQIRADLVVVGCDGCASFPYSQRGRIRSNRTWRPHRCIVVPHQPHAGRFGAGARQRELKALILINRSAYFQAGLIIAKGSYDEIKAHGIDALRADIRKIAPYLGERVNELHDWEQIKILTVQINRLQRWYRPGLLCIGDAAHAMSPAGGVGINLAIQDAVAAANLLTGPSSGAIRFQ